MNAPMPAGPSPGTSHRLLSRRGPQASGRPDVWSEALLAGLLALSVELALTSMFQYEFPVWALAGFSFLFSLLWVVVFTRSRAAMVFVGALLLLLVYVLLQAALGRAFWSDRDGFFVRFVAWIGQSADTTMPAPPGFLDAAAAMLCFIGSFITASFVLTHVYPLIPLVFGASVFFLSLVREGSPPLLSYSVFLLSFGLYVLRYRFVGRRGAVRPRAGRFALAMLPVCLPALCLLPLLLPQEGVYDPLADRYPLFTEDLSFAGDMEFFNFGHVTLSRREPRGGMLGGPRRRNPTLMLTVETGHNVYLRGHVYGDYTGRAWQEFGQEDGQPYLEAAADTDYRLAIAPGRYAYTTVLLSLPLTLRPATPAQTLFDRQSLRVGVTALALTDYFEEWMRTEDGVFVVSENADNDQYGNIETDSGQFTPDSVVFDDLIMDVGEDRLPLLKIFAFTEQTVSYRELHTRTLFLGNLTRTLGFRGSGWDDTPSINPRGDLTARRQAGRDFTYTLETAKLDLTQAQKAALYRRSYRGLSRDLLSKLAALADSAAYFSSLREGADYLAWAADEAYNRFTALPGTLPGRVAELALELTAGAQTDYDKAEAIARYLRGNYTYDLNVNYPNADRDFVDQFLFDTKRGYCTYFATAMAVLTRAAGLPARYVEGFAPAATGRPGLYSATGDNAHAWTEVYLDGLGWVEFDATAPVADAMNLGEDISALPSASPPPSFTPPPSRAPVTPTAAPAGKRSTPLRLWPLFSLALLGGGFWVWRRLKRPKTPETGGDRDSSPSRRRAKAVFARMSRALARRGLNRAPHETPIAFGVRADRWGQSGGAKRPWPAYTPVSRLAETYAELLFSVDAPPAGAVERWEEEVRQWVRWL